MQEPRTATLSPQSSSSYFSVFVRLFFVQAAIDASPAPPRVFTFLLSVDVYQSITRYYLGRYAPEDTVTSSFRIDFGISFDIRVQPHRGIRSERLD
jgi:hypothetical protein